MDDMTGEDHTEGPRGAARSRSGPLGSRDGNAHAAAAAAGRSPSRPAMPGTAAEGAEWTP